MRNIKLSVHNVKKNMSAFYNDNHHGQQQGNPYSYEINKLVSISERNVHVGQSHAGHYDR